ncbi:N-acetylmuramoyl-L-alanine amidase [Weissella thailandensis]|uniref:N-acetylmuramoyl-L-alanine amidase n=1 Tax=Weissella thailandensis TaxID=89061 RepID=A0ABX9I395_9LACO|nr:N-acetylmuramoyl-L-alanine amidase [Weissella thailandensis]RDS59180.1 N-acetylmuramoyl-L-alanine amidase [Weissella thailandensis]GEP74831.1 putative cell wall amidase lytH [Weissella thailandensis]
MKDLIQLLRQWLMKFWVPLTIVIVMLGTAISLTVVLLHKQQVTVQIPNLTLRKQKGVQSAPVSVLKKGEHLQILKKSEGWYQIRREDESTGWVAGWLLHRQKPLKTVTPLSETTIVLDPGHGGSDVGSLSTNNKYEKTYTLQLAKRVAKQLRQRGARVIMTRNTDKLVYLAKIPKVAEDNHADMFISFHFDSSPEPNSATGYTSYYYHKNNGSYDLASNINAELSLPLVNKGVEYGDFLVIRDNSVPAVLLENGYMNSKDDFKSIKSKAYQDKIAKAIPVGIQNYLSNQTTTAQ